MLRSLRLLARRGRFEDNMSDELRFHVEQYIADLVTSGVPREEAERRARIEFGSVDNVKDDCRQARGLRVFDDLSRNIRHAARLLVKAPGFTAAIARWPCGAWSRWQGPCRFWTPSCTD